MNKNYRFGIIAASIAAVLASAFVYVYWMYSPDALYRRGVQTAFWLSLEGDERTVFVKQGQTVNVPVELHYWKDLEAALYVGLDRNTGDEQPAGLSIELDIDRSVISVAKDSFALFSFDRMLDPDDFQRMKVTTSGDMTVREVGVMTVSASEDVSPGTYYSGLHSGDTAIRSHMGGNSQLITVIVESTD